MVRTIDAMRISLVGLEICSPLCSAAASPSASAAAVAAAASVVARPSTSSGCTRSRSVDGSGPFSMPSRIGGGAGGPGTGFGDGIRHRRGIMHQPRRDLPGGAVPELPSGTVTFLFTDLEGSTRLWEQHPGAMPAALERHDGILRDAVDRHRGRVVKTTGDGLHAVFVTTRDALDAALAAQRALVAERWAVPGGLRVRMGLHTGDAVARDGDYYGAATNRAARVMAAAHGEQVVVSHATEEIVRDTLPDEVALLDLGEHRLPDLARPERIFQVVAAGLRRDFPPLRSLDAMPGNLPGQLTSFVGREVEREAIADALLASRLVTVTGVGGVGKSRIAIQVALDIVRRFPDGAWLCELATATDDEGLAQVVAATLGVLARPAITLAASIIDALRTPRARARARQLRAHRRSGGAARRGVAARVPRRAHPGDQPRGARHRRRAGVAAAVARAPGADVARSTWSRPARRCGSSSSGRRACNPASCSTRRTWMRSPRSVAGSTASRSRSSSPPPGSRS